MHYHLHQNSYLPSRNRFPINFSGTAQNSLNMGVISLTPSSVHLDILLFIASFLRIQIPRWIFISGLLVSRDKLVIKTSVLFKLVFIILPEYSGPIPLKRVIESPSFFLRTFTKCKFCSFSSKTICDNLITDLTKNLGILTFLFTQSECFCGQLFWSFKKNRSNALF